MSLDWVCLLNLLSLTGLAPARHAWRALYTHTPPTMRHFSIQFMAENIAFEILAAEVILTDENIIHRQG